MKIRNASKKWLIAGAIFLAAFLALTYAVINVDTAAIGPNGSVVGLSALNAAAQNAIGVRMEWYVITDWLGVAAVLTALCFAIEGLMQLIKRKSLFRVDKDIIIMGIYYIIIIALYVFFETHIVNYRPVLMDGRLEASFPSSHTMIVSAIMGAAMARFARHTKNKTLRAVELCFCAAVVAVTVGGRLISGVHYITDIIAGALLGGALISLYIAALALADKSKGKTGQQ